MHLVRAGKTLLCVCTIIATSVQTVHADKNDKRKSLFKRQQQQSQPSTQEPQQAPTAFHPPAAYDPADNYLTLDQLVDRAIAETARRRLTAGFHTPWQIVHGILALRWDFMLWKGPGSTDSLSAIEWMASGPIHDGLPLWQLTPYGGRGQPFTKPYAFEGHPTQFMGYMTMADIPADYKFKAGPNAEHTITIRDIINDAKMQVKEGPEITWTLWAISHYESPDAEWTNAVGEPWSIERLVKIQTAEQVITGACGGCHGLFALAYARNKYLASGQPLRGVWLEADQKIKRYIEESRSLQNGDGSFSTNHFKGPGWAADFPTRIATSGHQLEWLMISLPKSRLNEEWVRRGVERIAREIWEHRREPSDCGPLYHAVHALVMYRLRTRPNLTPGSTVEAQLAKNGQPTAVPSTASQTPSPMTIVHPEVPKVAEPVPMPKVASADAPTIAESKSSPPDRIPTSVSIKNADRADVVASGTNPAKPANRVATSQSIESHAKTPDEGLIEPRWLTIQRRTAADEKAKSAVIDPSGRTLHDPDVDSQLDLGTRDGSELELVRERQKSSPAAPNPRRSAKRVSELPVLR
jgi:hypothetical protein